jgi:RNA polymerase sigma factor (sigma-70 family)
MDEERFRKIWKEYYPRITVFLRNFGLHEPEDAVQETLLKVYRNYRSFRAGASLSAWIYAVARNQAIDCLRKQKRLPVPLEKPENLPSRDPPSPEGASPNGKSPGSSLLGRVEDFLNRLDSKDRAAVAVVFAASVAVFISAPPKAPELSRALAAAAESSDIGENIRESLGSLGYAYRMYGKYK